MIGLLEAIAELSVLVAALFGLVLLVIVARIARRATGVPAAPEEIR